jgi:two-component system copper resistance phosphate regulon response regulator CusR
MKILIVEDEIKTGEYLNKGLTEAGFVVDHADNGLTGYHLAMTAEYDLLILDIMLPDVNGWDIIRMLRTAGKVCRSYYSLCPRNDRASGQGA